MQKQIPDTTRVKIFAQLANNYSNYDSALFYAKLGLDLSKKNNYLKGEAACYLQMGYGYTTPDHMKAIEAFQKSLEISRNIKDDRSS